MNIDDKDSNYIANRGTLTWKKFVNYIENLLAKPDFIKEIEWFREYHRHHDKGIPVPDSGLPFPKNRNDLRRIRREWCFDMTNDEYENFGAEYETRKASFIEKYHLKSYDEAFDFLVLFNSVKPMDVDGHAPYAQVIDLKFMTDLNQERKWPGEYGVQEVYEYFSHQAEVTPIAITINPYMNKEEVIDLIRKRYETDIKPIQYKYRNPDTTLGINRARQSHTKEMREFIYKNRNEDIHHLTEIVNQKFLSERKKLKGERYGYPYIQAILREILKSKK